MAKGNRGGKRAGGTSLIATGTSDLDYTKVGKTFEKLPQHLKDSINENLKMTNVMQQDINNGRKHKITDEWVTGFGKNKRKVITDVVNGKVVYTVKDKNKIIKKNVTKSQCANAIADFYLKALSGKL